MKNQNLIDVIDSHVKHAVMNNKVIKTEDIAKLKEFKQHLAANRVNIASIAQRLSTAIKAHGGKTKVQRVTERKEAIEENRRGEKKFLILITFVTHPFQKKKEQLQT